MRNLPERLIEVLYRSAYLMRTAAEVAEARWTAHLLRRQADESEARGVHDGSPEALRRAAASIVYDARAA